MERKAYSCFCEDTSTQKRDFVHIDIDIAVASAGLRLMDKAPMSSPMVYYTITSYVVVQAEAQMLQEQIVCQSTDQFCINVNTIVRSDYYSLAHQAGVLLGFYKRASASS